MKLPMHFSRMEQKDEETFKRIQFINLFFPSADQMMELMVKKKGRNLNKIHKMKRKRRLKL